MYRLDVTLRSRVEVTDKETDASIPMSVRLVLSQRCIQSSMYTEPHRVLFLS